MLFLTFNSVIVSWMIVLVISVSVGILVAKTLGPHVRLSTIVTLSFLNLVAIGAMIFIFIQPSKSEAQVYAYAEVASVLIIILLCLLPPTLMLWFVRLLKKR